MRNFIFLSLTLIALGSFVQASCPLDHLLIGRNPDGLDNTADDMTLYVDVTQKYRHSDPEQSSVNTWHNWYYPLYFSARYDRYQSGEPGFDVIQDGSNQELVGQPIVDYRLIVECVNISSGLQARNTDPTLSIDLSQSGDAFCHSCAADSHVHLQYRLPATADANEPCWITFRIYDELEMYSPSEDITIVFLNPPLEGDLVVDNHVNLADAAAFCEKWLIYSNAALFTAEGKAALDLFERSDINRDYSVNMADFVLLARNWLAEGLDEI